MRWSMASTVADLYNERSGFDFVLRQARFSGVFIHK